MPLRRRVLALAADQSLMWQKGWWMLLLILGTIAILFVINWLMILKYGGHS